MESELYEAAFEGNVPLLLKLLSKDKLLLDRITTWNCTETPLHIAALCGHWEFVEEILARKPELAKEQNSRSSTPLHLAAAKGYLNIVKSLLRVNPNICFFRDKDEMNPLHVAALKGHVDVLELLVETRPDAALRVIDHGQTILHLCVKHNKLEALKLLIDKLDDDQFINSRGEDGNTILHLAAADRQTKTICFLTSKGVNPNITNSRGFTALALSTQGESVERASEIAESHDPSRRAVPALHPPVGKENKRKRKRERQNDMQKTLMLVATLLATMAFQAGTNPPGGFWQDDFEGGKNSTTHAAGDLIMAQRHPGAYKLFVGCNTISFVGSLSIILLLISGFPLKRRVFTWIAMLTMWVATAFMAATYALAIFAFTPEDDEGTGSTALKFAMGAWAALDQLVALLFLCHLLGFILKLVRKILKFAYSALKKQEEQEDRLV